jgi:hypothetical protein
MSARKPLDEAFKPAAAMRGSGLSGILGRRDDKAAIVQDPPASRSTPDVQPLPVEAPVVSNKGLSARVRSVPAYLDTDVRSELRKRTRRDDVQNADLLLDAFDELSEERIRAALQRPAPEGGGQGKAPRRPRPEREQPKVQTNFRLDGDQEQWLDALGATVGAPSRTALFNTVLRLWFQSDG